MLFSLYSLRQRVWQSLFSLALCASPASFASPSSDFFPPCFQLSLCSRTCVPRALGLREVEVTSLSSVRPPAVAHQRARCGTCALTVSECPPAPRSDTMSQHGADSIAAHTRGGTTAAHTGASAHRPNVRCTAHRSDTRCCSHAVTQRSQRRRAVLRL
jgi:hypothetical protein